MDFERTFCEHVADELSRCHIISSVEMDMDVAMLKQLCPFEADKLRDALGSGSLHHINYSSKSYFIYFHKAGIIVEVIFDGPSYEESGTYTYMQSPGRIVHILI